MVTLAEGKSSLTASAMIWAALCLMTSSPFALSKGTGSIFLHPEGTSRVRSSILPSHKQATVDFSCLPERTCAKTSLQVFPARTSLSSPLIVIMSLSGAPSLKQVREALASLIVEFLSGRREEG